MADLTPAERTAIAQKVAEALTSGTAEGIVAPPGAPVDPKTFFCNNWDNIKTGLGVLQGLVPAPFSGIVGLIITVGNGVKSAICG